MQVLCQKSCDDTTYVKNLDFQVCHNIYIGKDASQRTATSTFAPEKFIFHFLKNLLFALACEHIYTQFAKMSRNEIHSFQRIYTILKDCELMFMSG